MQSIKELPLKAPFQLWMIEIAWVQLEIVRVHGNGFIFEFDDDLDAFALGARGEVQERVFVEAQLSEDAVETRVGRFGHLAILAEGERTQPKNLTTEGTESSERSANIHS